MSTAAPPHVVSDVDLFDDQALADPYPLYGKLRDAGPATYLSRHGLWFLSRYDQVRAALGDWKTYSSDPGIGLNDPFNTAWSSALICLDPPAHDQQRPLFSERLSPRALRPVAATIDAPASALPEPLLARGGFDAVTDLAHHLPITLTLDLLCCPP